MANQPTYNDNVFINCPFDEKYESFFNAMVFTVYRCGFLPRCAKEDDDGTDFRLNKIIKIISECKYGIHDISRTELDENNLPRFNMPYELGLFWGAKKFGINNQKKKNSIVLEKERYLYQKYISDLNGIDTKAHEDDLEKLILLIRNWLNQASRRTTIPGHKIILENHKSFFKNLPEILSNAGLDLENLAYNDLCLFIEEWLKEKLENE